MAGHPPPFPLDGGRVTATVEPGPLLGACVDAEWRLLDDAAILTLARTAGREGEPAAGPWAASIHLPRRWSPEGRRRWRRGGEHRSRRR